MENYNSISESLLTEIENVAKECGINNLDKYYLDVIESINLISDEGKTSMYQDIISKKKTEVDIFSGEIRKYGPVAHFAEDSPAQAGAGDDSGTTGIPQRREQGVYFPGGKLPDHPVIEGSTEDRRCTGRGYGRSFPGR
jgi:hypothetical protein